MPQRSARVSLKPGKSRAALTVTAAAHKLARLVYTMLTESQEYTDKGQDYYEERYRQRVMHHLAKRAEKLGMHLVSIPQPA